jgi:predicted nucleic acid-binding Zn ribbon protein
MRKSNEKPIKVAIEEFLEKYHLNNKMSQAQVLASWESVVGEIVAKNTKRLNIQGKTLYVKVESAALKNELMYARNKIIQGLNKAVGSNVIDEIILT